MADKVYQLPYDDVIDKDISEWLNSLPRSRKAELVRNAIRSYLRIAQSTNSISVQPTPPYIAPPVDENNNNVIKKKPKNLPHNGDF